MIHKRAENAVSASEDVIEVQPELLALLQEFGGGHPKSSSGGQSRSLAMLKKGAGKRKRPRLDGAGGVKKLRGAL